MSSYIEAWSRFGGGPVRSKFRGRRTPQRVGRAEGRLSLVATGPAGRLLGDHSISQGSSDRVVQ